MLIQDVGKILIPNFPSVGFFLILLAGVIIINDLIKRKKPILRDFIIVGILLLFHYINTGNKLSLGFIDNWSKSLFPDLPNAPVMVIIIILFVLYELFWSYKRNGFKRRFVGN
jgi:hypothetical protein